MKSCRYNFNFVEIEARGRPNVRKYHNGLQSGNGDTPGSNNVSTVSATNNAVVLSK
ncbi:MAG: hypothetical protein LBC06_01550 [Rickettsiales bacterium]|jgi:hypothetical protein|nr:hypothetical protein [Rickettsiales bacterium]